MSAPVCVASVGCHRNRNQVPGLLSAGRSGVTWRVCLAGCRFNLLDRKRQAIYKYLMDCVSQIDDPKQRGVLVVDDDPGPRAFMQLILKTRQYTNVHFAVDGMDALDKVETLGASVYVILLDMRMPRMDGMAFLKHLGEREEGPPVGVIVMTGFPTPEGREAVFEMETRRVRPFDYLSKPFEMSAVLDGVSKSMEAIHRLRGEWVGGQSG